MQSLANTEPKMGLYNPSNESNCILTKKNNIPKIVSFVNYAFDINKTSITPLKLHNVNQFSSSVKLLC